jgi:hypothetical protein
MGVHGLMKEGCERAEGTEERKERGHDASVAERKKGEVPPLRVSKKTLTLRSG